MRSTRCGPNQDMKRHYMADNCDRAEPFAAQAATWRAKRRRPVVARKADYGQRYKVERSFA
jgi:hypothetical protein